MPNASVAAAAEGLPTFSRRSLLAGGTAAALGGALLPAVADAATPSPATPAAPQPDQALIDLGLRLALAIDAEDHAMRRFSRADGAFQRECVERGITPRDLAAYAALREALLDPAIDAWNEMSEQVEAVADAIRPIRPASPQGLAVKARVLAWDCDLREAKPDDHAGVYRHDSFQRFYRDVVMMGLAA